MGSRTGKRRPVKGRWDLFLIFNTSIYFWLPWVFAAPHGLSLGAASGGCSLVAGSRLPQPWSSGSRVCWLQWLQHVDSAVVAHGLSCPHGTWNLPRPGIEPVSPTLAGGFLTTRPPGKHKVGFLTFLLLEVLSVVKGGRETPVRLLKNWSLDALFSKIWWCLLCWVWTKEAFSTKAACRGKEGIK